MKNTEFPFIKSPWNNFDGKQSSVFPGKDKNKTVHQYKVILLGDGGVGKTSIYDKFTTNTFSGIMSNTLKIEFRVKTIEIDNQNTVDMQVWDTCGLEKFRTVTRSYYRNNHGCVIIFDITCRDSFNNVMEWYRDLKEYGLKEQIIVIVGNKKDLSGERLVYLKEIDELLTKINLTYIEVSAKTGENVQYLFEYISLKLLARDEHSKKIPESSNNFTTSEILRNSVTLNKSLHSVLFNNKHDKRFKENKTCC